MADDTRPTPLTWQSSAESTNPQESTTLPPEVATCLRNARFLHLATCTALTPHISLMNYTYLPSTPFTRQPTVVMTTNPSSRKTLNLLANPRVSLLVHDWVSPRPPTTRIVPDPAAREGSPTPAPAPQTAGRSSLARLLAGLNTSALSSISATIDGEAEVLERGGEEERWCRARHLENHEFGGGGGGGGGRGEEGEEEGEEKEGDGGRECFLEGEGVMVVRVWVREGRIADWKGGVKDWRIVGEEEGGGGGMGRGLVNGVE